MRVSLAKNSCDDPQDMPLVDVITNPNAVFSRQAVLTKPCPVPAKSGVYAWFFRDIPGIVPAAGCVTQDGLTLLYIGISPKNAFSRQNLRRRITYHYRGNAEGSNSSSDHWRAPVWGDGISSPTSWKWKPDDVHPSGGAMLERLDGTHCLIADLSALRTRAD